jgi:hypothetical protein
MSADKFQNAVVNISGCKHDCPRRVKRLQRHARTQVPLQRPLDGVLRVTFPGKRHRVDFGTLPVNAAGHVDVAERTCQIFRAVAAVAFDGRIGGAPHEGRARFAGALVQDGFAAVAGKAFFANADRLMSVARRDEAVDVAGDEGAAVLHDDDVFAFAAAGFASVFVAFVLLKAKKKFICTLVIHLDTVTFTKFSYFS